MRAIGSCIKKKTRKNFAIFCEIKFHSRFFLSFTTAFFQPFTEFTETLALTFLGIFLKL
jgi:hypothetical protein